MYSVVNQTNKPKDAIVKKTQEQFCRAEFDYEAQGDQEISFKAGDLIKHLYEEDDTWVCGELNGKKGMFPKAFVQLITKWHSSYRCQSNNEERIVLYVLAEQEFKVD